MKAPRHTMTYRSIAILLALALAAMLIAPVKADGGSPVTGSFTTETLPQVDQIEVLTLAYGVPTSLTPNQEYIVRVTVSDANGIGDIDNIQLKFWYDDSGARSRVTPADFDYDNTYDLGRRLDRIQFQWDRASNNLSTRYAYFTLWEINPLALPTEGQLANPEYTSFVFQFQVKVSKAAQETLVGSGNVWQIAAKAENEAGGSYRFYGGATPGLPVDWYGEVDVADGATVDWGIIPPGLRFGNALARRWVDKDVTYYSNGDHYEEIKATTTWNLRNGATPATLSASASQPNSFALKAFMGPNNVGNAVQLDANGNFVHLKEYTNTGEYGAVVKGDSKYNNLYIQLSDDFVMGVYTGTITYGITNKIE